MNTSSNESLFAYHIVDWAGNDCFNGQRFNDFEDAEDFLASELGDNYDTDRQEYWIVALRQK